MLQVLGESHGWVYNKTYARDENNNRIRDEDGNYLWHIQDENNEFVLDGDGNKIIGFRVLDETKPKFGALSDFDDNNRHTGTLGDMGCFSFYSTKNLTTAEGGMILCKKIKQSDRLKVLRLHGLARDAWQRYLPKII